MAKVAFFGIPAHGHATPTFPVVAELVRRGETVVYYCDESFRPQIERAGADFRAYNPPLDPDIAQSASNAFKLAAALLEAATALLPGLLQDLERDGVDYIIHDSVCPWGRFAAEVLSLPAVASHTIFAVSRELFLPANPLARLWSIPSSLFGNLRHLRRIRRTRRHLTSVYGMPATRLFDVLSNRAPLNVVYTSRTFQPRPDLFDGSYEFVGPSLAPRGDEADFESELTGDPPIYISLGTIFNQESAAFYRCCFEALRDIGRQVVLAVGSKTDISRLGPTPANFLVKRWIPQLVVLSRASLFLTRSGMNSVNESLYYGVPMLLFPEILEQKLVADQVAGCGAGVILSESNLRPESLRREVLRLLGDEKYRQAAFRVGATLRDAGGYRRAADKILQYRASVVPQ